MCQTLAMAVPYGTRPNFQKNLDVCNHLMRGQQSLNVSFRAQQSVETNSGDLEGFHKFQQITSFKTKEPGGGGSVTPRLR